MLRQVSIVTLFPDFFYSPLKSGLLGKAIEKNLFSVRIIDIRDFSDDKFRRCDDYPYGGGSGMVLKADPLFRCLHSIENRGFTMLTSPSGLTLDSDRVKKYSNCDYITIICGHYEGIDERVNERFVNEEVSIGDYVLSGGEFAALVILDSVARRVPNFMSNKESLTEESFEDGLLEYPHYTRPEIVDGMKVPDVLLSGNHEKIRLWRSEKALEKTKLNRPDLFSKYLEYHNT